MNEKLIDSLVQIINALSEEERESLNAKLNKNLNNTKEPPDLTKEPFVGMWKDRKDLADSAEWVRQLRQSEWTGKHE